MKKPVVLSTIAVVSFLCSFAWIPDSTKTIQKEYYVSCIGFYNLENLFDTINDPNTNDEEYTPDGANAWTSERYIKKLENLSTVISELGTDLTPDGAAVIGVAEVENRTVLEDLVKTEKLKARNYKIAHFDSPDRRGVDVGLLYQENYFTLTHSTKYPLSIPGMDDFYTRDQLVVSGEFQGEPMYFIVAHWPSRRGGEKRSRPLRIAAAQLGRKIIDSIQTIDPKAKIVYMGDLNDDPVNVSVRKTLKTQRDINKVTDGFLYNTLEDHFHKGIGTLAWADSWNLFDQMIITPEMIHDTSGYHFHKSKVYNKDYLKTKTGNFKGYPFRTFAGGVYQGGYADHFPVYMTIIKEKK